MNASNNTLDLVLGCLIVGFAAVITFIGVVVALAGAVLVGMWTIPILAWLLERVLEALT